MAKQTNLELFIGTDFTFNFEILTADETTAEDISEWSFSWMVKEDARDSDTDALITITTADNISINGTFNSVPATNTQRAVVVVNDDDTISLRPGKYVWELKRVDATMETVLAYGPLNLRRSVHE